MDIFLILASSLASGLLGVIVSILYYKNHEKQQSKIETLKKFCANRYDLKDQDFTQALNEIFVAFQGSRAVQDQLVKFHCTIVSKNSNVANQDLVELFKAMCRDVKMDPNQFSEDFFLKTLQC